MGKNDFGDDNCPLCLLMRKADEINRLSQRSKGFRPIADAFKEK